MGEPNLSEDGFYNEDGSFFSWSRVSPHMSQILYYIINL